MEKVIWSWVATFSACEKKRNVKKGIKEEKKKTLDLWKGKLFNVTDK